MVVKFVVIGNERDLLNEPSKELLWPRKSRRLQVASQASSQCGVGVAALRSPTSFSIAGLIAEDSEIDATPFAPLRLALDKVPGETR